MFSSFTILHTHTKYVVTKYNTQSPLTHMLFQTCNNSTKIKLPVYVFIMNVLRNTAFAYLIRCFLFKFGKALQKCMDMWIPILNLSFNCRPSFAAEKKKKTVL